MADVPRVSLEVGGRMPFRYSLGTLYKELTSQIQKQNARQLQFKVNSDNVLFWKWSDETGWKEVAELSDVSPAPATTIDGVTGLRAALDSKRTDGIITITDVQGLDDALKSLGLWDSLQGKPSSFPPEPHRHAIEDVQGLRAELDAKLDDSDLSVEAVGGLAERLESLADPQWSDIRGRPETFPPGSHQHAIGDVVGLQAALDAKRQAGAIPVTDVDGLKERLFALASPSWSGIKDKPAAFLPSAHTHETAEISGLAAALTSLLKAESVSAKVVTPGAKVAVKFAKAYTAPPLVASIPGWIGQQLVMGAASEVTTTGCNVTVMQSRGTLLLTTGPFESAAAGLTASMLVIGS